MKAVEPGGLPSQLATSLREEVAKLKRERAHAKLVGRQLDAETVALTSAVSTLVERQKEVYAAEKRQRHACEHQRCLTQAETGQIARRRTPRLRAMRPRTSTRSRLSSRRSRR